MYINWAHHYIPKMFGSLAFIVNPIFVYLIFSEKLTKLGNYRFLLVYFSMFNLVYSLTVFLFPIGIYTYRYCFSIYISDGWFVTSSDLNLTFLNARCSLISGSYAVLLSHFVYRYFVIRESTLTSTRFRYYIIASLFAFLFYFMFWFLTCHYGSSEVDGKAYIQENFKIVYGVDVQNFNFLLAIYDETSIETQLRSFISIFMLTSLSVLSLVLFVTLGSLTMSKLNKMVLSTKTSQQQKSLLKALTVQTVIPIFVSFSPCLLSWYSPIFNIDLGRGINYLEVIAVAAFPFCDPIAIVFCLPALRNRVFGKYRNTIASSSSVV